MLQKPIKFPPSRFAQECFLDQDQEVTCRCPPGYEGRRCETCSPGFVGNPTVPGDSCRPGRIDESVTCRQVHMFTAFIRFCSRAKMFRVPAIVVYFSYSRLIYSVFFFLREKIFSCVPVTCTRLSGRKKDFGGLLNTPYCTSGMYAHGYWLSSSRERSRKVRLENFRVISVMTKSGKLNFGGGGGKEGAIRFPSSFSFFPTQFHFEFPLRFKCISNCRQRRIREYVRKKVWRTINSSSLHLRRITHCNDPPPGLSRLKSGSVLINFEPRAHFGFPDKFFSLLLPTHILLEWILN